MRVTVEMSLYPLADEALDKILALHRDVLQRRRAARGRREPDEHAAARRARRRASTCCARRSSASFGAGGSQALVVKFLNADLPIGEPPVLDPPRAAR